MKKLAMLLAVVFAFGALGFGCGKKDDAAKADPAAKEAPEKEAPEKEGADKDKPK
jgi:hypothetical protein